ncbi:MAG TPA: VOC family protein [Acidimicrobiales bacterium]|nr:VOC family protein [Acidimicrobiales bacterium]
MTTSPTVTGARAALDADAPIRLSHLAYVTHDTAATVDFYTRIMRMPLIEAVMHERVPSTGDPYPYVHFFFRMQDGSTIAFFEAIGLPERAEPSHPAYDTFDHLALEVASTADVDEWHAWLVGKGVDVLGPVDHTIIYSIYFHDPNGIRLEITTPLVADWNDRPAEAERVVAAFLRGKDDARATGRPAEEVLREVIAANDRHDASA